MLSFLFNFILKSTAVLANTSESYRCITGLFKNQKQPSPA